MADHKSNTIEQFVEKRNASKQLFTAGPASLLAENITGLRPCFGRGDADYDAIEESVLNTLMTMSGHSKIARLQGSASLSLEIMVMNFLYGRILVVSTGYYSDRMNWLAESAKRRGSDITQIFSSDWEKIGNISGSYDWVVACPVETSCGLKIEISELKKTANRLDAKLMLDATASIGLEKDHHLADVIAYSSCKGLFGLTGASFISFNEMPSQEVDSFYLNLSTHLNKMMTGPYHAIASLADVFPKHDEFKYSVERNKKKFLEKFDEFVVYPEKNQPLLCTYADCKIESLNPKAILYKPRSSLKGSVVCHLGEVHLGKNAKGSILHQLTATEPDQ